MKIKEIILLILIILVAALLRFSSLGYSHFYGDETKTFYLDKTVSATNFFLGQRKAPVQFLVVWSVEKLTGRFNEFEVRLPFAIIGFLSVLSYYFLVRNLFSWRVALFSTALFAINGFNIAFSRTAQYQSILIFTGLLSIFFIYQYSLMSKNRYIYLLLSSLFLGISFLTHYDALFFAIPCLFIFSSTLRNTNSKFKTLFLFCIPLVLITSVFYVPYFINGNFASNTFNYLSRRASGDTYLPSNSIYTSKVYNPYLLGFIPLFFSFFFFLNTQSWKKLLVFVWFIIPYILFEYVFQNPGTHIYNYYLPLFILAGIGFVNILDLIPRAVFRSLLSYTILIFFIAYGFINASVYIPQLHTGYPWLGSSVDKNYHLYIYGFPYNRAWDKIKLYFNAKEGVRNYYTNDNATVAAYYLRQYDLTPPGTNYYPQYYVYVKNGQEFKDPDSALLSLYTVEKEFYDNSGTLLAQVLRFSLK